MTTWPNPPASSGAAAGDPAQPQTRELPGPWTQPQSWARPGGAQEQAQAVPPPADQQWQAAAQPAIGWGAAPPGWAAPAYPQAAPGNGMAVASLVLGITSIIFCWWGLATLAQVVLAIVFGCLGMSRAASGARGRGMAIAGLVCGCVGALFYLLFGVFTLGIGFLI
jgi:Domain of unknown function (DUF4190)